MREQWRAPKCAKSAQYGKKERKKECYDHGENLKGRGPLLPIRSEVT
jgi:hypothetical protein